MSYFCRKWHFCQELYCWLIITFIDIFSVKLTKLVFLSNRIKLFLLRIAMVLFDTNKDHIMFFSFVPRTVPKSVLANPQSWQHIIIFVPGIVLRSVRWWRGRRKFFCYWSERCCVGWWRVAGLDGSWEPVARRLAQGVADIDTGSHIHDRIYGVVCNDNVGLVASLASLRKSRMLHFPFCAVWFIRPISQWIYTTLTNGI